MTPTMIIMPNSRKMTFQSMPACSEKNTWAPGMSPVTAIRPAAMSTTLTLSAFSVAMNANATTKIVRARIALIDHAPAVRCAARDAWPPIWLIRLWRAGMTRRAARPAAWYGCRSYVRAFH